MSPPILRSGSSARYATSCSTYGYMQADVLPVPTAPTIIIPVYKPRSGMTSQRGSDAGDGDVRWCCSPSTRKISVRSSGDGYCGSGADRVGRVDVATKMYVSENTILSRTKGVVNHT